MTWAIPGLLSRVPVNNAAEVRTDGRICMQLTLVVPIHGKLRLAMPHQGSGASGNLRRSIHIGRSREVRVLGCHVEILFDELRGCFQ